LPDSSLSLRGGQSDGADVVDEPRRCSSFLVPANTTSAVFHPAPATIGARMMAERAGPGEEKAGLRASFRKLGAGFELRSGWTKGPLERESGLVRARNGFVDLSP